MLARVSCLLLALAAPAAGVMLTVTIGADTADRVCGAHCSLRAAITVANALPGPDHIALPAGTVTLSISGANENANASGDLDVTSDLVISGAGADRTLIDAQRLDRALHVRNASLELEDLQLRRGRAGAGDGGGVAVQGGALTLRRVLVRDCASDNWGGGVYVGAGDLLVEASTLADNRAERGGGLYFQGFSRQLTIDNSTISGNLASTGGGIFVDQECGFATTCAITSSTIADNRGGGLRNVAGAFALALGNDLFAGNAGGNCAPGSGHSLGHNLDDDGSCPLIRPSDRPNTAAALRPLAVTGGPTPTQALAAGSAAIDGGDPDTCPPLDQRGQARVGACDIGAHEATAGPCGDGVVDRDEACDGGAGADPCCSRACAAAVDGSRCTDDGDPCLGDRCRHGRCEHAPVAAATCRVADRDHLLITGAGVLDWRWQRGAATAVAEFGLPAGTSALCVFDGEAAELLASRVFPAGGDGWRAAGDDGFQFADASARAVLRAGGAGRARIAVQAGSVLPADVATPLRVEWRSAGGTCWASQLTAADVMRDDAERLVARRQE